MSLLFVIIWNKIKNPTKNKNIMKKYFFNDTHSLLYTVNVKPAG